MPRLLLYVALALAVLLAVRWLLAAVRGGFAEGRAELERGADWEAHTESGGGQTSVVVRRVSTGGVELGRQLVAAIPDSAPDWEERYHDAMAQARSRVAALRSQTD